jgi:hypothetical protein
MGGLGVKAKEVYFDDLLEHIKQDRLRDMSNLEIRAVVMAAGQRDKLEELDKAVKIKMRYGSK